MFDNDMLSNMPHTANRLSLDRELELIEQLKHYLPAERRDEHPDLRVLAELVSVCAVGSSADDAARRAAGLPTVGEVTTSDLLAALCLVPQIRRDLDATEIRLIEAGLDRGETFESLGAACGLSRQGMRQRYQRLGGTRRWPATNDDSDALDTTGG